MSALHMLPSSFSPSQCSQIVVAPFFPPDTARTGNPSFRMQVVSFLQAVILAEGMAEIRSSHKSGNQMTVFFVQKAFQTFYRFL